jgi:hypothetical protein
MGLRFDVKMGGQLAEVGVQTPSLGQYVHQISKRFGALTVLLFISFVFGTRKRLGA